MNLKVWLIVPQLVELDFIPTPGILVGCPFIASLGSVTVLYSRKGFSLPKEIVAITPRA